MEPELFLNRFISVIYRQTQRFYNRNFDPQVIRRGQYFFLVRISENEGISVLDLAKHGHYDKGTTAKAIQKLKELGYITIKEDENDRRIHRLYTTALAKEPLETIRSTRKAWERVLLKDFSPEEIRSAQILLKKMAENSYEYISQMELNENESRKDLKTDESLRV